MDSEVVRSFSPARDERWRKKLQRGQKKATPQFGSENWQKLRLPTSQVYTLENANSNFLSKPPQCLTGGSENPLGSEGVLTFPITSPSYTYCGKKD